MEFYKLFRIVHRRTDWIELWTFERKTVMPEWYEERGPRSNSRSIFQSVGNLLQFYKVMQNNYMGLPFLLQNKQ